MLVSLAERSTEAKSSFSYPINTLNNFLEKGSIFSLLSEENNQDLLPATWDSYSGKIHFEWSPEDIIALALPLILPQMETTETILLYKTLNSVNRGGLF